MKVRIIVLAVFIFTTSFVYAKDEKPEYKLKVKNIKTNLPPLGETDKVTIKPIGDKIQFLTMTLGLKSPTYIDDNYSLHGNITISKPLVDVFDYNLLGWYQEYGLFKATDYVDYSETTNGKMRRDFGVSFGSGLSLLIGQPESFSFSPYTGLTAKVFKTYNTVEDYNSIAAQADMTVGMRMNFLKLYWLNLAYNINSEVFSEQTVDRSNSLLISLGIGAVPNRPVK